MGSNKLNKSSDIHKTRVSLLNRASVGNHELAWEELVGYYEPFVKSILGAMSFRGADLEDASQQVFIRLWKGLHSYKRDERRAKFRTWFARLIRNTALNIIQSKKRQPTGPSFDDDEVLNLNFGVSDQPELEARVEEEWQEYIVKLALDHARTVFSGHAISTPEQLMLFYTGNVRIGEQRDRQTMQCLAVSKNGIDFEKLGPVISQLPEGVTPHCRDPKVIKVGTQWWMLVGVQRQDLVGRLAV